MLIGALLFDRHTYRVGVPPVLILAGIVCLIMGLASTHGTAVRALVAVQGSVAMADGTMSVTVTPPESTTPVVVALPPQQKGDAPNSGIAANRIEIARATHATTWQSTRTFDRVRNPYAWWMGMIAVALMLTGAGLLWRNLRSR